jgi:broad specificity phosphatase PhoE
MRLLLWQPWVAQITAVYCSTEQKAMDGAALLAAHLGLPVSHVADLGENERSATGYLPAPEFERVVDQFFAHPTVSMRGWEPAAVAQQRIVRAVTGIIAQDASADAIAIVAHGGVGTLLLCALAGYAIDRRYEQPGTGGGHYYAFDAPSWVMRHGWRPIDIFE